MQHPQDKVGLVNVSMAHSKLKTGLPFGPRKQGQDEEAWKFSHIDSAANTVPAFHISR